MLLGTLDFGGGGGMFDSSRMLLLACNYLPLLPPSSLLVLLERLSDFLRMWLLACFSLLCMFLLVLVELEQSPVPVASFSILVNIAPSECVDVEPDPAFRKGSKRPFAFILDYYQDSRERKGKSTVRY